MDFFEQQERARRKTFHLLFYYLLAVIGIVGSVYLAFTFLIFKQPVWRPDLFVLIGGGTLGVIFIGTLGKSLQLAAGGGGAVAVGMGGRPVDLHTQDPAERKLLNVVEEMSIASGTPCPEVYLLDGESGINAFAAGKMPSHAAIGVSRGCVSKLSRDELQGVIGHEFSHILNGDMRLNLRLISILSGILLIATIGYWTMRVMGSGNRRSSREDGKGTALIFLLGLVLLAIGYIGVFFAHLIQCAVCRQREFLADASSVQFTRNPLGIAGALRKIQEDEEGSVLNHHGTQEVNHMLFCDGVSGFLGKLFADHPPIPDRLKAIGEARLEEGSPPLRMAAARQAPDDQRSMDQEVPMDRTDVVGKKAPAQWPVPLSPVLLAAQFGAPTQEHIEHASNVLEGFPQAVREGMREPFAARAIFFALLLDANDEIRKKEFEMIAKEAEPGTSQETEKMAPMAASIPIEQRISLASLLIPALRHLTPSSYENFRKVVNELVDADGKVDLFEFTLQKILFRHLDIYFRKTPPPTPDIRGLDGVAFEISSLLSALAHSGNGDPEAIQQAFQKGASFLKMDGLDLLESEKCGIQQIDSALDKLSHLIPPCKKQFMAACFATAAFDGTVTIWDGELLRAIADSLDCPLPPLVAK